MVANTNLKVQCQSKTIIVDKTNQKQNKINKHFFYIYMYRERV